MVVVSLTPGAAAAQGETFTITATASAGGTISPSGNISVATGGSQTFTLTPDTGYTIGGILVTFSNDEGFVNPQSTYTFSNVRANHTIQALFTLSQVVVPPPELQPLNQTPVPIPPNLTLFIKNKSAAIQLGKAFFWEMQTGSDGMQACASCHFSSGVDGRRKNTVHPGPNGFEAVNGPNETIDIDDKSIFPFHERGGTGHLQSDPVIRDLRDIVGSQGVRKADFVGIVEGSAVDDMVPVPDPVFNVDGANVRQVTARQAPTVYDAAFNFTQFWDGRASFIFNGQNPFGLADPDAGVWFNDLVEGLVKRPVRIEFASLASQSTGPPMDPTEMSATGRTFPELGRKLLSLTPLGKQLVSHDDSVLGGLSNSMRYPDGSVEYAPGLHDGYADLIQAAFRNYLWDSAEPVTITVRGAPMEFTQMEANFALFWGLAIQLYESTLISDQTPFDFWLAGEKTALTEQQKKGFALFSGNGKCNICHGGIEFTNHSVAATAFINDTIHGLIEMMFVADGRQVIYDEGFNNTSVTRTMDDVGRGGTMPFINPFTGELYPLSFSALAKLKAEGKLPYSTPILDPFLVPYDIPVNASGSFKVPGLRNIALTAPYFHNGGVRTLDDVLDLYIRGGNHPAENSADLDADIAGGLSLVLNDEVQEHSVIEFLKSLTDPRVVAESAPFDHPELFVPEGDPEILRRIPGTDSSGVPIPALPLTINPVTSPTNTINQTVSGYIEAGLVPQVTVSTTASVGDIVADGTVWSVPITGLVEGPNVVTATVTDNYSVITSVAATIIVDTIAPAVSFNPVTSPTTLSSVPLSGTAESGAIMRVVVNGGMPALAIRNGTSWSFIAALEIGENTISVIAADGAGNTTELPEVTVMVEIPVLPASFTVNLSSGWGLLSTPVKLDAGAQNLDQIFNAQTLQDAITIMYRWDGAQWQQLVSNDALLPLEAIYVKVNAGASAVANLVASADISPPPSRELGAGLYLIAPAPALEGLIFPALPLDQALLSIAQAPGGFTGYSTVVSPGHNQAAWTYTAAGQIPELLPFKGYWVMMENPDTLYGFSVTPLTQ